MLMALIVHFLGFHLQPWYMKQQKTNTRVYFIGIYYEADRIFLFFIFSTLVYLFTGV